MKSKSKLLYIASLSTIGFLILRNKYQNENKIEYLRKSPASDGEDFGVALSNLKNFQEMTQYIQHFLTPVSPQRELNAPDTAADSAPPTTPASDEATPPTPEKEKTAVAPPVAVALPMPKLHLEYLDSARNPLTQTKTYRIDKASTSAYTLVSNETYLNTYKNPALFSQPAALRPGATLGDYYDPKNVVNMIKYLLQPSPRENASHTDQDKRLDPPDSNVLGESFDFTLTDDDLKSIKLDLAYLLQLEMNLQSERAENDKGNNDKDLLFTKNDKGERFILPNYSQIGDLAYSREGAAILWTAINRIGRGINKASNIVGNAWNPGVANRIKRMKDSKIAPKKEFVDFIEDFMNGKYPNEIGHREAFVHYPRQVRVAKSVPAWALPLADPKRAIKAPDSMTTETLLINDLLTASGSFDLFSQKPNVKSRAWIAPYCDPKRKVNPEASKKDAKK